MNDQTKELLYQALETEIGGQQVYKAAIRCAVNEELKEEWQTYLEETENHERILRGVFTALGLDQDAETPGRSVVRMKGEALVAAMDRARSEGPPEGAEMCAAESVVEAETKDHQNWEVIGTLAKTLKGEEAKVLKDAYSEVEEEEDEHLYHTMGWSRELWLQFLGLPAKLPPPEEEKNVTTGVDAAKTQEQRLREAGAARRRSDTSNPRSAGARTKSSSNGTPSRGRTAKAKR